jgi:hypothetical protein
MILTDYSPLEEAAPKDRDTFRARLISPGWGSSGYYSPDTLKEAAYLYKAGLKMYLNHPTTTERRELPERDVSKIAGYLTTNAVYESGSHPGLYAYVKVLPKYLDLVRTAGMLLGLSHYAEGQSKIGIAEGRKGSIVEKITRVVSVDLVTEPGRGGRICESGRYIRPTEDDGSQAYFESLVNGGMSERSASYVLTNLTGKPFAPAPVLLHGEMAEANEALIQSYIESGMKPEIAKNIVMGL